PFVLPYLCCDRRCLHSFPTRRSSDLFSGEDAYFLFSGPFHKKQIMTFLTFQTFLQSILLSFFALIFFIGMNMGISVDFGFIGLRSEEHTSELQSRFDLVCRLLLE